MNNSRSYGLCYQGSKNRIAEWVVDNLPPAKHFYDLFCGGGAITHVAIKSGKFRIFTCNDLNPLCQGFVKASKGGYKNKELDRWISREEFEKTKSTNPIAFYCYSFGGNGDDYAYSKEIEPYKKALHNARLYGDLCFFKNIGISNITRNWLIKNSQFVKERYIKWYLSDVIKTPLSYSDFKGKIQNQIKGREDELRQYLLTAFKKSGLKSQREVGLRLGTNMERHYFGKSQWEFPTEENYKKMQTFMPLDRSYNSLFNLSENIPIDIRTLTNLENLSSFYTVETDNNVERVKNLRSLSNFDIRGKCGDYSAVTIEQNSLIYCDIPYRNTTEYIVGSFDHHKFYDWALAQKSLVVISEYDMPEPDFIPVAGVRLRCQLQSGSGNEKIEKMFIPKKQWDKYKNKQGLLF